MAGLGTALVGDGLETWFVDLEKPSFLVPLWVFYLAGGVYYALFGVVIYRIAAFIEEATRRHWLLGLTVLVMLLNELWNFAFFGLESTLAGFVGIVLFLFPLLGLTIQMVSADRMSGMLLIVYTVWVVYDVVWTYALWRLNA
jgi:tryptophan-rich sensory protein